MSRRLFIGDVHGQYDGLMRLLALVAPTSTDRLHFVGDLIDRGPKSAQVVEFVRRGNHICVLGNHEHLLLSAFPDENSHLGAFHRWLNSGGQPTLTSYASTEALLDHVDWLRTLPLYLDLGDIFLVHAGLNPRKPLSQQGPIDFCWIRDEFHAYPRPALKGKRIITGHTITFTLPGVMPGQIAQGPGWIDVDTGAYHPKSGWLTALDIDNDLVYQVNILTHAKQITTLAKISARVEPTAIKFRGRRQFSAS